MSFPGFKAVSMVAAFGIALSPLQALAVTSTASPIATITATPTATATRTPTATPTSSPSVTSTPTATATATPTATSTPEVLFSDVTQDHWAYNAIQSVVQKKIMNGYGDSSFRPDQPITRAETTKVVTLAATRKILEKPAKVSLPFPDVSPQDGLIPYIQHAYDNKIIKGYADKTFRPSKPVTRGEFLKIFTLSTNSVFKDYDTGEAFLDVSADNDLASYIYSARALGYIKGSSTGLFYPNIPITRAEAAQIIYLYLNDKDATFAQATDLENKMLQQINAKRAAEGKGALILDDRLGSLAKKQSQELFDQWHFLSKEQKKAYESSHASQTDQDKQRPWTSHRNASGLTFDQWFSLASKKFNINYNEATQNIAHAFYDSATPADRVNDIINKMFEKGSDGTYLYAHAYNLLGSYVSYTHIGLGIVVGDEPEEMYVTQILTR